MVPVAPSKQMETFGRFLKTFLSIYQTTCCHILADCDPYCQLLTATSTVNLMYRVIRNDCRGFNNLSYTIHLK